MLQIHPIAAFNDNYFWLIQPNTHNSSVYIVDPGAAEPVYKTLQQLSLTLTGILITHHHRDHINGAEELSKTFNIPIYGPQSAKIPQITHKIAEGDILKLGQLSAQILTIAGHTLDHIGYYIQPVTGPALLFCGDTLFAAGCGRLFDGSAVQLFQSLQRIMLLPNDTLMYCGHEYTLANLRFALHIEPDNSDIIARQLIEQQKLQHRIPTVPTNLLLEKRTNPFLRCHLPQIRARVEQLSKRTLCSNIEIFTQLRLLKDQF